MLFLVEAESAAFQLPGFREITRCVAADGYVITLASIPAEEVERAEWDGTYKAGRGVLHAQDGDYLLIDDERALPVEEPSPELERLFQEIERRAD